MPKRIPVYGPRTRSRGETSPTTLVYSTKEWIPPNPTPTTSGGTLGAGGLSGFSDRVSDIAGSFKKASFLREWKVTQPFSLSRTSYSACYSSATTSYVPYPNGKRGERTWTGDGVSYIFGNAGVASSVSSGTEDVPTANLISLAVIGCLGRVNPAQSQSLVTVAESRKTIDTILSRAKKLADTYVAIRRGDVKRLTAMYPNKRTFSPPKLVVVWDEHGRPILNRKGQPIKKYARKLLKPKDVSRLDDAARLELEFRYGWTPLVHDMVDSLKAIYAQQLRDELTKREFTKVFERKEGSARRTTVVSTPSFGGGTWMTRRDSETQVSVRAYARYTVTNPGGIANRMNDFGIFDYPRYLWEVTPLSFVADWFIPIGDWLGALSPKVGVNVIDSGVVVVTKKKVTRTLTGYTPSASSYGSWPQAPFPIGSSDQVDQFSIERTPGLPVPLFPPPEVKLNFKRLADAAALLRVMR